MKKYFSMLLVLVVFGLSAQAQVGTKSIGVKTGYAFDSENFLIGADFRYNLTDPIRVSGSLVHLLKKDHLKGFNVDFDMHYLFPLSQGFQFYPLVGLNYTNLKVKYKGSFWGENFKYKDKTTKVGINIGLGFEYAINPQIIAGIEAKYLAIKDVDQAFLTLRLGYCF